MALKHWVWLATRSSVGAAAAVSLLGRFGTPEEIYFAGDSALKETGLVSEQGLRSLGDKDMRRVREIIGACMDNSVQIVTLGDAAYPERLKNIYDPPLLLYVLGRLPDMDSEAAVAIVGTRKCTPYGVKTAEKFGYEIARAGGLVISGLARGIDSAAARGALRGGGSVVGVLGTAIDVVYPSENRGLFRDVISTGAIVSEYPPGAPTTRGNFPARNRIMSGLSVGVTVIEAPERSGALITAAHALEQGRDVFAVPGNVDAPSCAGSNGLLREGAQAAVSGAGIVGEYAARFPEKLTGRETRPLVPLDPREEEKLVRRELKETGVRRDDSEKEIDKRKNADYINVSVERSTLSEAEARVADVMTKPDMQIDEIIAGCGLPASEVLSSLTLLQLKGAARQSEGKRFTLTAKIT
ncbi:MAG: DNA-processing protein DprA [Oscillospiraceae bacterium]|nr:DNA-processing protein DprA [Oscillospiraceae bacterium]